MLPAYNNDKRRRPARRPRTPHGARGTGNGWTDNKPRLVMIGAACGFAVLFLFFVFSSSTADENPKKDTIKSPATVDTSSPIDEFSDEDPIDNASSESDDIPVIVPTDKPNPRPEVGKGRTFIALDDKTLDKRAVAVRSALQHAWNGYRTHAWGQDELKPVSERGMNWLGLGLTIVDTLDTLWMMGMMKEFKEARDWIASSLDFNKNAEVSVFETNIRVLGGLLSAYDFSQDKVFLKKAEDIGDRLLYAFNTSSGVPFASISLNGRNGKSPGWTGGSSILAEFGTVQLEYKYLTHVTGNDWYRYKVQKIMDLVDSLPKPNGLAPIYLNPHSGHFAGSQVTFGALGDSYYEYLLKQWLQTSKTEPQFKRMYDEAMAGMFDKLLKRSTPSNYLYIADWNGHHTVDKMDHLACFAAGMLALGAQSMKGKEKEKHMDAAKDLGYTCYQMYHSTPSGISAESVHFSPGGDITPGARYYILRPEVVESFMYLWRFTHEERWREYGWEVFENIEKHCKTRVGYAGLRDVMNANPAKDDQMQSFFLAETLKYLFMLFSPDDLIPLDKYVFNTEAHPLSVWKP